MPVYLCQPGLSSREPWRHGVQVYERPFPLPGDGAVPPSAGGGAAAGRDAVPADVDQTVATLAGEGERFPTLLRYIDERTDLGNNGGERGVVGNGADGVLIHAPADGARTLARRLEGAGHGGRVGLASVAGGTAAMTGHEVADVLGRYGRREVRVLIVAGDGDGEAGRVPSSRSSLVVNYGCPPGGLYRSRLAAASPSLAAEARSGGGMTAPPTSSRRGSVVTLYVPGTDGEDKARDVADAMREGGCSVPRELAEVARRAGYGGGRAGRVGRRDVLGLGDAARRPPQDRGEGGDIIGSPRPSPAGTRAPPRAVDVGTVRPSGSPGPVTVRKVRHAEVVLADQCLVAYGRTWLRLRWPGEQGGFAGFVAMSRVGASLGGMVPLPPDADEVGIPGDPAAGRWGAGGGPEPAPASSSPDAAQQVLCRETGTYYPTSDSMRLLDLYDDGLGAPITPEDEGRDGREAVEDSLLGSYETGEPVFCRICREGLHDIDYDLDTTAPSSSSRGASPSTTTTAGTWTRRSTGDMTLDGENASDDDAGPSAAGRPVPNFARPGPGEDGAGPRCAPVGFNPLADLPPLVRSHPTADNPLLSPCQCTGSMAFVHYLCVEQWRCRSRHPAARGGLACETCGGDYALPPPPARTAGPGRGAGADGPPDGDWLDAMPPHVLAALRRPHPWWQMGAALVRRRWLRPVVPVAVSPLVALYCRARRTLKKRGVSRRRWACSLCRRRARWKCVRCLRSYYCSRQCQNVSWHIVHKHVCYKPARFWWSVVAYSAVAMVLVPDLLVNLPMYDAMVTLAPVNFLALGVIGGGAASSLKRLTGRDARGRALEAAVVALTALLSCVTSGLVRAYFGDASRCWGATLGGWGGPEDGPGAPPPSGPFRDEFLDGVLVGPPLRQAHAWYGKWDRALARMGPLATRIFCEEGGGDADYPSVGCSPATRRIDPRFYLDEEHGARCSSDMALVLWVWLGAVGVVAAGGLYREVRARRANNNGGGGVGNRGRRRVHQD